MIKYRNESHKDVPHVVKFSGGRSSAMMLFMMLSKNLLSAERGDVVVFNNTSAEHLRTYEFVLRCKSEFEKGGDIPFFLTEYQTCELERKDHRKRGQTYRLCKPKLLSEEEPEGMHWRGELFEEMISFKMFLPNMFNRTCTDNLKINVSRKFLSEWFTGKDMTKRIGHQLESRQMSPQEAHKHYRGDMSYKEFVDYKSYMWNRPFVRHSQRYDDYTANPRVSIQPLSKIRNGSVVMSFPYVSLLGLRADESKRVEKVIKRCDDNINNEIIYAPMCDAGIRKSDVMSYWKEKEFDLGIDSIYSNCVFCFLKNKKKLNTIKKNLPYHEDDPSGIGWWQKIEEKYKRPAKDKSVFGFAVKTEDGFYNSLETMEEQTEFSCFCTD